jgi:hypothetical protein
MQQCVLPEDAGANTNFVDIDSPMFFGNTLLRRELPRTPQLTATREVAREMKTTSNRTN